ncbi:3-oxoacyl-[acyl-carrier-protein] reductase FabG isoform X2 [Lepeophtheirus salmonis]|nr:3-oxoacyl-[acyl-carrier-protein] reductase FabG-like isoform X2 [Lepeophtheirus salmonis]
MTNLGGKVALITGASSGIGRSTAILFAKLGATLSITGRDIENLQKTAKECEGQGGTSAPLLIQASLDIEEDVKRVVEETINRFGRLDILVNNAGILERGSIENTSLESYDRVMNINVRSVFQTTSLATPHLIKTKGNIVNVSSVNGIRSFPGVLAYNMSKSALDQFTKCIALELAPKNVRVNSVNPGVIISNLHYRAGLTDEQYEEFLEHSKNTHALGRPGNPDEVAKCIAFFASSESSFCTGVTMPVDGGRHAMCPR